MDIFVENSVRMEYHIFFNLFKFFLFKWYDGCFGPCLKIVQKSFPMMLNLSYRELVLTTVQLHRHV